MGGKGETWHNGHRVPEDSEEKLDIFDRLAMGDQVRWCRNWTIFLISHSFYMKCFTLDQTMHTFTQTNSHTKCTQTQTHPCIYHTIQYSTQLMMLRWTEKEDGTATPMGASDAVNEFQEGLISGRGQGGAGSANSAAAAAELDEERRRILEEREKWEKEKSQMQTQRNEEEYQRAMSSVDNSILDLLPKVG